MLASIFNMQLLRRCLQVHSCKTVVIFAVRQPLVDQWPLDDAGTVCPFSSNAGSVSNYCSQGLFPGRLISLHKDIKWLAKMSDLAPCSFSLIAN